MREAQPCESSSVPSELPALLGSILARALSAALRDSTLRAEVIGVLREATPTIDDPPALLTAAQLAKRLGISVATVRRLEPPHVVVGDACTKRYDIAAVRAFLDEREPRPTTPTKPPAGDDVDVASALAAGGLRMLAGGRRA